MDHCSTGWLSSVGWSEAACCEWWCWCNFLTSQKHYLGRFLVSGCGPLQHIMGWLSSVGCFEAAADSFLLDIWEDCNFGFGSYEPLQHSIAWGGCPQLGGSRLRMVLAPLAVEAAQSPRYHQGTQYSVSCF